jgi:hypothetical protein
MLFRCKVAWILSVAFAAVALAACGNGTRGGNDSSNDGGDATCEPPCGEGMTCCEADGAGRCVNVQSNASHCGSCGNACPSGQCSEGMCTGSTMDAGGNATCSPECGSDTRCCGGQCVSKSAPQGQLEAKDDASFQHCGACNTPCDSERATRCGSPLGGGPTQCLCGNFEACAPGSRCVQNNDSYQCTDLQGDPDNCGGTGNQCSNAETCSGGQCVCGDTGGPCPDGKTCCQQDGTATCVDTDTNASHCGGCGNSCGAYASTCEGGSCKCGDEPACEKPSGDSLGELCCDDTCVAQDSDNCGRCGHTCGEDDQSCIQNPDFLPGGGGGARTCCGEELFGGQGFCLDGFGSGDGGLPGPGGGGGGGGLPDAGFGF